MEYQKDTNQGNIKGQEKPQHGQGYSYVVRKAEKLTTALYLVTDILRDMEPLKWRTRESGVEILSDISIATSASSSDKLTILRGVIKKIERVVSFLDIASSSRMMTEMNASVLKREYLALRDAIEGEWRKSQEHSKLLLTDRFFDVPGNQDGDGGDSLALKGVSSVAPRSLSTPAVSPLKPLEQKIDPRPAYTPPTPKPFIPSIKNRDRGDSLVLEGVSSVTPQPPRPIIIDRQVVERPRVDDSRDDRRKIILALLKQKPAVNVGDIAKSIPGVSEKTIQRELLAMVSENILIKRGERRWSTYSLRDTQ